MQVVSVDELSDVVEHRLGCSPNFKYFYDPKTKAYQGRPHQYNCTYYSALGGNARHYLLARAIQFFTPGIPMVYYVGLFAGLNDYDVGPSVLWCLGPAWTITWQHSCLLCCGFDCLGCLSLSNSCVCFAVSTQQHSCLHCCAFTCLAHSNIGVSSGVQLAVVSTRGIRT